MAQSSIPSSWQKQRALRAVKYFPYFVVWWQRLPKTLNFRKLDSDEDVAIVDEDAVLLTYGLYVVFGLGSHPQTYRSYQHEPITTQDAQVMMAERYSHLPVEDQVAFEEYGKMGGIAGTGSGSYIEFNVDPGVSNAEKKFKVKIASVAAAELFLSLTGVTLNHW